MTTAAPTSETIGFIGIGVMGASMVVNLRKAGYPVAIYSRTKAKAERALAAGATWCATPAAVAAQSSIVCTMVGAPADVDQVWLGADGALAAMRPGSVGIDFTTSSPSLARTLAERAEAVGCTMVDAPVSGGDIGAREARLSIMIGGTAEAFARIEPILHHVGTNIVHQGPAGAGQHCKMANQIAVAANMIGVCESMQYARLAGLDPQVVLKSISTGAAASWSLTNLAPRMLTGDCAPGFYVKHFLKDLDIALTEARSMGLHTPGVELAESLYALLRDRYDGGEFGTQALIRLYVEGLHK